MAATGRIYGHTYFDLNANSHQDSGEGAVANFRVDLFNANGTTLLASTLTDGNGDYSFGNLADGTYSIRFETTNGFRGDTGTRTPDGFDWHAGIVVQNGQATTLDQGFYVPPSGTIDGTVFADTNGNGHIDSGDGGLAGVVVTARDAGGHVVATTTTDGGGVWALSGLDVGQYSITYDATGTGHVLAASPDTVTRTIIGGTEFRFEQVLATTADKVAASLSGTVYADANGNHRLDGGETGVAGANVAVIDGNGYVVATLTTDQNGHYVLPSPVGGQNYRVVVSPPTGYAGEDAGGAAGLTLAAGQARDHVDLGLTAVAPATTEASPDVTRVINVVLRGQSNTAYPTMEGAVEAMRQQIQLLLGFDGVNQRVNLVAVHDDANFANTEWSGTALTADWLHPDGSGWASTTLERGYLSAINQLPATDRGAPTAIVMLHNESDSDFTAGLTADRWESAVRYEAGLARAVLGLSATDAPYLFVSPIPFALGASYQPQQNQAIAVGQAELSADPTFNARVVALQTSDVTMNHDDPNANGGAHLNAQDQAAVYGRVALGIAQQFASSAMPGSPVSHANGNIDNLGPQVTKVDTVAGHANQLLLTLAFDAGSSVHSLGAVAAAGTGWSIRSGYGDDTAEANGTRAELVDGSHLLLTFDNPVPTGERLFYTWGSLRLQQNNGPGNGNAIYDINGLPLSVDPHGLAVGYAAAGGPTIAGTLAGQTTAQAALNPFATATLADPSTGATDTLRISLSGAGGTLSGTGLVATNDGAYTLTGSAAGITTALQALTFTPSAGQTGTTTFTLQAVSNAYPAATTDSTTTVVAQAATGGITAALFNDTGASAADGITKSAVITGVTDAGASVTLTDETNHAVGSATAGSDGRYTITPTGLVNGAHTLTATETYRGASTNHASVSLMLDTVAPTVTAVSANAAVGANAHYVLSGTLDAGGTGATVTIRDGTTILGTTVADDRAHFSFTLPFAGGGTQQDHSLTVSATDIAGNTSDSFNVHLDQGVVGSGASALFGTVTHDIGSPGGEVYALYDGLLQRAPDPTGLAAWASQLAHGASLHDVTAAILSSAEFTADYGGPYMGGSNEAFVNYLYEHALGRSADAQGAARWAGLLASGTSRVDVASAFALSPENQNEIAPALATGIFVPDAEAANVARLYYAIFDRAPDASGLRSWENAAHAGTSLTTIATTFLNSAEYALRHPTAQTDQQFVDGLYHDALGRPVDLAGEAHWIGVLAQGATRAAVAATIAESPEAHVNHLGQIEVGWHLSS